MENTKNQRLSMENELAKRVIPLKSGDTRFCILPFTKPQIHNNQVYLCCSQSLKVYPVRGQIDHLGEISPEKPLIEIWNGEDYRKIRQGMLTGTDLPKACANCEKAPSVPPIVMQFHIALMLAAKSGDEKSLAWISENAKYYSEYKNVMQTLKFQPYDLLTMLHMNWGSDDPKIKTITTWINYQNLSIANVDNTLQLTTGTKKLFGRSDSIIETTPQQTYLIRAELEAKSCPVSMAIYNEGHIRSPLAVSETVEKGKKQVFMLFVAQREKTVISLSVRSMSPNKVANVYKVDSIQFETLHINCWSSKKNNEKHGYSQIVESWFPMDAATLSLTAKGELQVTTGNKKLYGRAVGLIKTQPGKVYKISACIEADSSPASVSVRPLKEPLTSKLFNSLPFVSGDIVSPGKSSSESVTFVAKSAVTQVQIVARSTLPGKKIRAYDVECIEINNVKALLKIGSQFQKEGELDDALAVYQQTTELNPKNSRLYQALGEIYAIQGRWKESLSTYHKAFELNGDSAWNAHGLGRALAGVGRLDEAIAHYRSAIALDPECSIFYRNLGIALAEKGELKEASVAHEKSIQINPYAAESYYNLGTVLTKLGKQNEAMISLKKALQLKPEFQYCQNLGKRLTDIKQWDEAIVAYQQAIALKPDSAETLFRLGQLLILQGKPEEGIAAYEKALEVQPNYTEVCLNLSYIHSQANRWNRAKHYYDLACKIRPQLLQDTEVMWSRSHFINTSYYKILVLDDLSDRDRLFLEKEGLLLENISKIQQEFSIDVNPYTTYIDAESKQRFRDFQQKIIKNICIEAICPRSGKIVKSNQSFYLPNHVTLYRFETEEVFYILFYWYSDFFLGIYFPNRELYIQNQKRPLLNIEHHTWSVGYFKAQFIRHLDICKEYIKNDRKEIAGVIGYVNNISHNVWNELAGIQDLLDTPVLAKQLKALFVGPYDYFKTSEIFSELNCSDSEVKLFITPQLPSFQWRANSPFELCVKNNYFAMRMLDYQIQEKLASKIYKSCLVRVSKDFLQNVEASQKHYPLLWLTIRSHKRVWLSQVEGLGFTIAELYKKYPNMGIIFDGMKTERETMEKIKSLIPKSITTYNGLDCSREETIVWSHAIDLAVAPAGAGVIFTTIVNKPSVMHGPKKLCHTVPRCSTPRENCVLSHFIDPQDITDETDADVLLRNSVVGRNSAVGRNYDFDWKKLYSKVIAVLENMESPSVNLKLQRRS